MQNTLRGLVAAYGFVEKNLWTKFVKHRNRREQRHLEQKLKETTLYQSIVSKIDELYADRNTVSAAVTSFLGKEENNLSTTLKKLNYKDVLEHFYDITNDI